MSLRDLRRVGHVPTLAGAFLHFEVSFAVWVLLGALAPYLARDFALSPAGTGLLVATPLLAAAGFRVLLGWLADARGPRRVGTFSMAVVLAALGWGWLAAGSIGELVVIGVLLGVAGASFAVALPLAGHQFPPSHRGLALGIVGAGNSGTIGAMLLAPRLAESVGWHATFGLAMLPALAAGIAFRLLAREAPPAPRPFRERAALLREPDCWRLCGLYAVTFGGFVGLASYLPTLLVGRHGAARVLAGTLAAAAAGSGSLARPVGGWLSDRFGGARILAMVYATAAILALTLAMPLGLASTTGLFVALLGVLGIGNGAVVQLIPPRFPAATGLVIGLVGAAGGVGGFLLPVALGAATSATGSHVAGLVAFAAAAALAARSVVTIRLRWLELAPEEAV